ncbi:MAG: DUF92 domain-containing protein [Bacilli bacterium]|nr:DUF92 domain-containing protein [Bacilli bacterium]
MKIFICLLATLLLMYYAYSKKAINLLGTLIAGVITYGATYYGGYPLYLMIFLVFFVDLIFSKITKTSGEGTRNEIQMLCNLLLPYIAVLLYYYSYKDMYLVVAAISLAECLADSLASTIGEPAKHHFNLRTFKKDQTNISGNISLLGILGSLFGSLIIAIVYYAFINHNCYAFFLIGFLGTLGAFIDSVLGAYLQVAYVCPKCKKEVEEKIHCKRKTKKVKGLTIIDNNMVNFLSQLIVFILGILFL